MKRRALLLLALLAVSTASARYGEVDFISSGLVSFTITPEAYAAALACAGCNFLHPDPGQATVLEVRRQSARHPYTLEVFHGGFSPANPVNLEARYTVTDHDDTGVLFTIDWQPVSQIPTVLFNEARVGGQNRVRVEVEYRLRVTGAELAGSYLASVTYRIRENNDAVTHNLRVTLPSFLTLRLVGQLAPGLSHTVSFDYSQATAAYLHAISSGIQLPVTGSSLERLEISTNHPTGYTVTVIVSESPLRDRLRLFGAAAHGRRFSSSGPTNGFVTLLTASDFGLVVDGGETPGVHILTVRYEAVRNP